MKTGLDYKDVFYKDVLCIRLQDDDYARECLIEAARVGADVFELTINDLLESRRRQIDETHRSYQAINGGS